VSLGRSIATVEAWGRHVAVPTRAPSVAEISAFAAAAAAVTSLGWSKGGYYATTWNCATIVALGLAGAVLLRSRRTEVSRADCSLLILLAGFAGWLGLHALRPGAATQAVPEMERAVLYLSVALASLLTIRASTARAASAGVLAGIVAVSCAGLVALLLPDHVAASTYEGRLLFQPLGYANASGILAVIGILLALGLVGHLESRSARALSAAALVPLVAALALSGSRGATAALAVGFAAAVVLDPDRRRLGLSAMLLVPLPLLAVWVAGRSHVSDLQATTELVARDGKVVAAAVALLAASQAAFAWRFLRGRRFGLRTGRACAVVGCVLVVAGAVHAGAGALGDRPAYWRAAAADYRANPVLGSGPGTFGRAWLQYRDAPVNTQNAHSLYLETLAEVGPVGIAFLIAALGVPLVVAVRSVRSRLTATACSAYVAFLVHAALDWDWQLPAVTVAALLCAAIVLAASRQSATRDRPRVRRLLLLASGVAAVGVAAAGIGNLALAAATRSAQHGDWAAAGRSARSAGSWQPWSGEPRRLLAESYLVVGEDAQARAALEQALRRDPRDWRAWYELGSVGDRATRRVAYAHILRLNPLALRVTPEGSAPRARP
jgi:O-Antigen ligase